MRKARRQASAGRLGSIIVVSAPSGTGKTTLTRRLQASLPGLRFSVSHTTRPRRPGEREARDYFFVDAARFKRMIAAGEFAEWAQVFGHLYGTSWNQVRQAQRSGVDLLLDIDVQGHRKLKRKLPEAVSVFIVPPSFRSLERRLRHRRMDSAEDIARRLRIARKEVVLWREYDYFVVNRRLRTALEALKAVVVAARCRRIVQKRQAWEIFKTFGG